MASRQPSDIVIWRAPVRGGNDALLFDTPNESEVANSNLKLKRFNQYAKHLQSMSWKSVAELPSIAEAAQRNR